MTSSTAERELFASVSRSEIPVALMLSGSLVLAIGAIDALVSEEFHLGQYLPDLAVAAGLLAVSGALTRWRAPCRVSQWAYAAAMTVVVVWLLGEFRLQPDVASIAYAVIVMSAFGAVLLSWPPFLAASAVMAGATVATLLATGWRDPVGWTAACLVAVLVGALFLRVRRHSLAALAESRSLAERLATTDPLTGLLNRHGLELLAPGLVASAIRYGQPLVVWLVDIDDLRSANARRGHEFGDQLIRTVGDAVRSCARKGDLIARWGGDEFLVVGFGIEPGNGTIGTRLHDRIRAAGIPASHWAGTVTIGTASRMPQVATLERLIAEAYDHMAEQRAGE